MSRLFSAIEIEINHHCNRRCSYCPNSVARRKDQGEIDPALFDRLLLELGELDYAGRVSYSFYNEPLLHSGFESVVRRTRERLPKASIVVYTNGTLLGHDRLRALLDFGVSRFIVTRHEQDRKHAFEAVYARLGPSDRKRVHYRSHLDIRLTNRGGMLKHLGAEGLVLAPCHVPGMILTVTVSGNVLPCFEDYEEKLVMGSLRERTLREIWESERFARFRQDLRRGLRHAHSPCRDCNRFESLPAENP